MERMASVFFPNDQVLQITEGQGGYGSDIPIVINHASLHIYRCGKQRAIKTSPAC